MIASRYLSKAVPLLYVANLKGLIGDWGYTTDYKHAIVLSPYWQRRFAADCRAVGATARFTPVA